MWHIYSKRLNWVRSWRKRCVLRQPILTLHVSKIIKKPFSLFLSPLPISLTFPETLKAWSNVEGATISFFCHIFLSSAKSSKRTANFTKKSQQRGCSHTQTNHQSNSQQNTVRNPCHKLRSTQKRINLAVSTSNFTSILQYPSHKEQHRQQYY